MRIPSPMGETPGSSSGGEGWRQVVRDVGNLQASSPELERGTGDHAGSPSPLDEKLQPCERLTTSQLQGSPSTRTECLWPKSPSFSDGKPSEKLCHVIPQKGPRQPRDTVSLSKSWSQRRGGLDHLVSRHTLSLSPGHTGPFSSPATCPPMKHRTA